MEHMNGLIERNTQGLLNMFNAMHNVDYDNEFENKFVDIVGKIGKRPDERTIKKRKDLFESISTEVATKGRNLYGLFNGLTHYITHKHKENTSWSSEYEQLVGNSMHMLRKLIMIGDNISNKSKLMREEIEEALLSKLMNKKIYTIVSTIRSLLICLAMIYTKKYLFLLIYYINKAKHLI